MGFVKRAQWLSALAAALIVLPVASAAVAQETTDRSQVTLDRLFGSGEFFPDFFGHGLQGIQNLIGKLKQLNFLLIDQRL